MSQNSREYRYEGFEIVTPTKHSIIQILKTEAKRNQVLRSAAEILLTLKYNHVIDVGANIGDTALTITKASNVPLQLTLIEPSNFFRKYLEINSRHFLDYEIIPKFVASSFPIKELPGELLHWGGTAQIVESNSAWIPATQQISLHEIVRENTGLIKIDCDGQDTNILRDFLQNTQIFPTIYFENTILDLPGLQNSQGTIELAHRLGYEFAIISNNSGHLMWAGQLGVEHLYDIFWMQLNVRLMGKPEVLYHTDILLVHNENRTKFDELLASIRKTNENYDFNESS